MRPISFLLLMFLSGTAPAAPLEEQSEWLAVLLNGNRAGHMQLTRQVFADRVETSEAFFLKIDRGGVPIVVQSEESYIETRDGQPLGFGAVQQISGAEMVIEGTIDERGVARVVTRSAGSVQTQEFPWPDGVRMAEGSRLLMASKGIEPGTEYPLKVFVPSSLQAVDTRIKIEGIERVDLFGVDQDLLRLTETVDFGQTETPMVAWINTEFQLKKTRMSLLGLTFEAIACPQACATAEVEPTEFFATALTTSPRKLTRPLRESRLSYRVRAKNGAGPLHFPESAEQQVSALDGGYQITIGRVGVGPVAAPATLETEAFLAATRWLQIDEPAIQRLARQARGDARGDRETMRRLEGFVRDYVSDKNLSVGYASALEVARNRSGDCTEHALLLAALGRAAGIPTRVATGLAYVERWLGAEDVFVPHAWTQALVDGRWTSYDAALGGFDAGHIALSYGDGDPWEFYEGVNTLGNIEIVSVDPRDG